jgi:hypothetical protein
MKYKKRDILLFKGEVKGARYLGFYEISVSNKADPEKPKKLLTIRS